jgi:hypothetical protein
MPTSKLPSKQRLIKKILTNFTKPGIKKIFLEKKDQAYEVIVILIKNPHVIENLMELEGVITDNREQVKFFYKEEWDSGELIWEEAT